MACGTAPAENEVLERFVKAYDKASPAGKRRLIVLVPQQMNLETERRLIEMTGGKGLFGAEVLSFLRRSARELGRTVVMVTHDPTAAAYADRVVLLADGRIVARGSHVELLSRPDYRQVVARGMDGE